MKIYGWAGLILLIVAEICLFRKIEPFYSWFYCFAWWSYILLADSLLFKLRGRSLLSGRRVELSSMLPLSTFIWLLFEGYNLAIRNWGYDGVPEEMWVRWPGYALAFATVLPGIFVTSDLAEALLFGRRGEPFASECEPLLEAPATRVPSLFSFAGILLSICPILWPRYFFPLVWVAPIFFIDPMLERLGIRSLSLSAAAGDRRRIWSLLLGGLGCGLLWEFWNFWAGSRWIYTVPIFDDWKIFQMPLLGFLGFPPFALECWILYHLMTKILESRRSATARAAVWLAILVISIVIMNSIDQRTVHRFA